MTKNEKTIEGSVASDERDGVEIRFVKDQKEVRQLLGDKTMDGLLDETHTALKGHTSRPGNAFVFLVFTTEGKGTVFLADREEQDADSDEDAITIRKKMARIWGEETELRLWLAAKKLKGWKD